MAKISLGRIFDTGKVLATDAGQQMTDLVGFVATMGEEVLAALKNGLKFADNFDCSVSTIDLKQGLEQVVNVGSKRATGMIPLRVLSSLYALDSFLWWVDSAGATRVKATFTGAPTVSVQVTIVILF